MYKVTKPTHDTLRNLITQKEKTDLTWLSAVKTIPSKKFEQNIINATVQSIGYLKRIEIEVPYIVCLTLVGVNGYRMSDSELFAEDDAIDRNVLLIPDILIEEAVNDSDVPKLLSPIINSIWNACGYMKSPNYDMEGNYNTGYR